jgi:protein-S-isoprenylcysteine O-methyltransferase Ste14
MAMPEIITAAPMDEPADAAAPAGSIPYRDGYAGLAGLSLAFVAIMVLRPHPFVAAWLILGATALPMLALELRRAGPATRRRGSLAPVAWALGFAVAGAPFLLLHWQGQGLMAWVLAWIVAAPAFGIRFAVEAMRTGAVSGGLPVALGRALLAPRRETFRALAAPARLFALKAIFVPLYALSLLGLVQLVMTANLATATGWLVLAVTFAYVVDLAFGLAGYVFASNELVPGTLRSTQTLALGWIVCLVCYGPVFAHWPELETVVHAEIGWPQNLAMGPLSLAAAAALVALLALYVSASVHFGLRFSNLSNRGVLTAGPYRYMKHPAYFAHVANAWIITLVLLPASGMALGPAQWLVPLAFTLFYRLRAVTEERHMGEDAGYLAYADWIARHGVLARLRRLAGFQAARSATTASSTGQPLSVTLRWPFGSVSTKPIDFSSRICRSDSARPESRS